MRCERCGHTIGSHSIPSKPDALGLNVPGTKLCHVVVARRLCLCPLIPVTPTSEPLPSKENL